MCLVRLWLTNCPPIDEVALCESHRGFGSNYPSYAKTPLNSSARTVPLRFVSGRARLSCWDTVPVCQGHDELAAGREHSDDQHLPISCRLLPEYCCCGASSERRLWIAVPFLDGPARQEERNFVRLIT
jgi:hypothetical protein